MSGPRGRGHYTYAAEEHGDPWMLTMAALKANGKVLTVMSCVGQAPPTFLH